MLYYDNMLLFRTFGFQNYSSISQFMAHWTTRPAFEPWASSLLPSSRFFKPSREKPHLAVTHLTTRFALSRLGFNKGMVENVKFKEIIKSHITQVSPVDVQKMSILDIGPILWMSVGEPRNIPTAETEIQGMSFF